MYVWTFYEQLYYNVNEMSTLKLKWKDLVTTDTGRVKLAVFTLVLIMNCLAVQTMDDFGYKINSGFFDILRREYVQYMTWTGRSVAHLIARSFLALPKIIFNVANSLCFVRLCSLITMHAAGKREYSAFLFALSTLTVFLFAPLFGQTCLWETGSCNYLWTTAIVLDFLLRYRLRDRAEAGQPVLMFLFGIIAGWTNENTGGALILMVLYFLCFYYRKNIRKWMISGLAGSLFGFVMMIRAPGNSIRALDFVSTNGFVYDVVHDLYGTLEVLRDGMIWLWIPLAGGLALCSLLKKDKGAQIDAAAYALCGAAAGGAIILSPVPVLYDRSMFGATILVITGVMICACQLAAETDMKKIMTALLGVMLVSAAFRYVQAVIDLSFTAYHDHRREMYVEAQKDAGNMNPVVPLIYDEFMTPYNPMFGLGDLSFYRFLWPNQMFAEAHGIETVQATALERWNRIYRYGDPGLMDLREMDAYLSEAMKGKRVLLVNADGIDAAKYRTELDILRGYGLELPESGKIYLCAVFENGRAVSVNVSEVPCELDGHIGEAYYYISSQDGAQYSDITVDGVEYTNDNEGITVVAYGREEGRVTDSVTWFPESDQGGVRYFIER